MTATSAAAIRRDTANAVTSGRSQSGGFDDARAHHDVAVVECDRLAGGDGALRLRELKTRVRGSDGNAGGELRLVAGPDLRAQRGARDRVLGRLVVHPRDP